MSSYKEKKDNMIKRLNRIEGQVRGVKRMISEDQYCIDVVNQISAVEGALKKVQLIILEEHTKGCVRRTIRSGREDEDMLDELIDVIRKISK